MRKVVRLQRSISAPSSSEVAGEIGWSEWSVEAEQHLEWLADAGNELFGAQTHWLERGLQFGSALTSRTPLHEIRIVCRQAGSGGRVEGATAWANDVPAIRESMESVLAAARATWTEDEYWIERRIA